ncbi:unnamed protein product [Orchesella dallaii]|uniref:V-SNARE coiled-coil homology domain-containing protein n=1 Tax=Orchesella dallaii TaxID=48710 RepID=A0ABP1Q475_9HEXA
MLRAPPGHKYSLTPIMASTTTPLLSESIRTTGSKIEDGGESGGGSSSSNPRESNRMSRLWRKVSAVGDILAQNIEKLRERDVKIGELETKVEQLEEGSRNFALVSNTIKQKSAKKNDKLNKLIAVLIFIAVITIAIVLILIFG